MGMMIGFILGYIFAWKAGPLDMNEIGKAWSDIRKSEEVKAYMGGGTMLAGGLFRRALETILQMAVRPR